MATLTFESWNGTPSWNAISYTLVFSGSPSNLATFIGAGTFNFGTHLGDSQPGNDQCGTNHMINTMLVDSTHVSINGGTSIALNDANLASSGTASNVPLRLHFNDSNGYSVQNGRIYSYDGTLTTNLAPGVDAAIYCVGNGSSQWFTLNSATTTGPNVAAMGFTTAGIGGDNSGSQYFLFNQAAAADHYYYLAVSVSPETAGGKGSFALGSYIEYY